MNGYIYVAGGYDGASSIATNVYRFDGVAWEEVASLPNPFADGAGAVLNGEMYVMGGRNGAAATNVYRYSEGTPGVVPSSGSYTGNYQVVISGTNLCNGTLGDVTGVTLCGIAATVTAVNGSTQIVITAGASGVGGLGDVRVFSTSFGETVKTDAFTYTVPGLQVLGTNGAVIASGSAVSSLNGTRFPQTVFGTTTTHTFSITNNGNALMTISGAGVQGSGFSVSGIPTTVDVGAVASFDVVFNPSAPGSFTSTLILTNNSPTSIYTVDLAGSCYQLSNDRGPYAGGNSITITNGNFGTITNVLVGGVAATITGSGATWVTITVPTVGSTGGKDILIQTDSGDILLPGAYTVCIRAQDIPIGSVVYDSSWTWSGSPLGWRVVDTNYGDRAGMVTLQATNSVGPMAYQSTGWANQWGSCTLRTWLNSASFLGVFSPEFSGAVVTTRVPWTTFNQDGLFVSGIVTDSVFIASSTELGGTVWSNEGSALDWFSDPGTAVARRSDISASSTKYWTRSGMRQDWSGTYYNLAAYFVAVPSGTITYGNWTSDPLDVVPMVNVGGNVEFALQPDGSYQLYEGPLDQVITFPNPGPQMTTNVVELSAMASSGQEVIYSILSGSASVTGGLLTFTGSGNVSVVASQPGNGYWNPASPVTNTFAVSKVTATVTLTNLNQTYNGTACIVGSVTVPAGLTVDMTYDGSSVAPTNAESYTVVGTVNDVIYQGGATDTLIIAQASQVITFPNLGTQVVTNTLVLSAAADSGLTVAITVDSGPAAISNAVDLSFSSAGRVTLRATQSGDGNWSAASPVTNAFDVIGVITNVTPTAGSMYGGTQVTIAGLWLGNGADITNVTLCNISATIVTQSIHSVTVTAGVSPVFTNGDVVVQSTGFGTVTLTNSFAYQPVPPPPIARSAVDVTTNRFTARWLASTGATNYLIDVSETNTFTSTIGIYNNWNVGDVTACLVTGLVNGTTYYYRLRAANSYGVSLDSNIIEVPVSDNTPYVQYEPTNGVASAGSSDVVDLTKLFHGTGMSYSVVANSNPGLVATSFIGPKLVLDYAPGGSGTASITVRATDLSTGFWVETTITVSVGDEPTFVLSPIVFNRQIGLFEQTVTVSNTSPLTAKAVTLTVTNLSAGVTFNNATGVDEHGNAEILWIGTLAPGGTMVFTLQYYTRNRTVVPTSSVGVSLSLEAPETQINGTSFSINGSPITLGSTQSYLIEFTAVPGRIYYIQYKATLGDPWKTVQSPIHAPVNRIQWIDSGPPSTESAPGSVPSRFYQVIELSL